MDSFSSLFKNNNNHECCSNSVVFAFCCFRLLSVVLRDASVSSRYADLSVDHFHMHRVLTFFLGGLLLAACMVFIFVLHDTTSNISVD